MSEESSKFTRREFLVTVGVLATGTFGNPRPVYPVDVPPTDPPVERPIETPPPERPTDPVVGREPPIYERFCVPSNRRQLTNTDYVNAFDGNQSIETFTDIENYEHISVNPACNIGGNQVLHVAIPEGNHFGTSLHYQFDSLGVTEPTKLYSQYYVYFPRDFTVHDRGGKLPGPAGTYGQAGWGGRPATGSNGWSARAQFLPNDDPERPIQLAYYAYHADMDTDFGDMFHWDIGTNGQVVLGRWLRIKQFVELNTPGENDGVLRAWVDDDLAFERTDVRFRDTDELNVQGFWFNVYYGGNSPSPVDNDLYFDVLSLSWNDPPEPAETS